MASGSAVRKDDPFEEIKRPVRSTYAIDMEGAAFYRTAADFKDVRALLVKGVADYADKNKDDSYHMYAAKASAAYIVSVIEEYIFPALTPNANKTRATMIQSEEALIDRHRADAMASRLAEIWGGDKRDLFNKINSSVRFRNPTTTGRKGKPRARYSAIDLVNKYYSPENLAKANLRHCSISVDGTSVHTTSVSRDEWLGLTYQLDSLQEQCKLVSTKTIRPQWIGTHLDRIGPKHKPQEGLGKVLADCAASIITSQGLIWDDPIYRIKEIELEEKAIKVSFALDQFKNYRYSIGLLNEELSRLFSDTNFEINDLIERPKDIQPLRSFFLPDGPSLVDFASRITASGIQVLFAMATKNGDYEIPYQIRSRKVTEGATKFGTIPMAFHQPLKDREREVNPSFSIYRELYEELFGGREVTRGSESWNPPDWFFSESEPIKWLKENQSSRALECTGIAVNLFSGNCDFLVLVAVHDETFFERFGPSLHKTWEAKSLHKVSTLDRKSLKELMVRSNWASQALMAMVEGLFRLKAIAPSKVDLPDLQRI
jgi:hypothetical protein